MSATKMSKDAFFAQFPNLSYDTGITYIDIPCQKASDITITEVINAIDKSGGSVLADEWYAPKKDESNIWNAAFPELKSYTVQSITHSVHFFYDDGKAGGPSSPKVTAIFHPAQAVLKNGDVEDNLLYIKFSRGRGTSDEEAVVRVK